MPYHLSPSTPPKYVSKRAAANLHGKTQRTITRWSANPQLGFPQPAIINGRWYFEEAELDAFDRRLATARLNDLACRQHAERKGQTSQAEGDVA